MNHTLPHTHTQPVHCKNMCKHSNVHTRLHTHSFLHANTDRLRGLDGHKAVVPFLPADVAEGSVVRDVLGDVGDLVDRMVVLEDLKKNTTQDVKKQHRHIKKTTAKENHHFTTFSPGVYDFKLITCNLFLKMSTLIVDLWNLSSAAAPIS